MKPFIEGLTLIAMSTLLCSLTVLGAMGVDPAPLTDHQKQLLSSK